MATKTNYLQQAAQLDPTGTTAVVGQVAGQLQSLFPRGTYLGNWLSDLGDPKQMVKDFMHALFGYKYTSGDYALGEILINRVMNTATTNRMDTPDDYVPIAWTYFTLLFGIPIAVNTDLDHINTSDYARGILDYRNGRPDRPDVTDAAIRRAITLMNHPLMKPVSQENPQWGTDKFGLVPYVAPIPSPREVNQLYTGQMPNGQYVVNGIIKDPNSKEFSTVDNNGMPVNTSTQGGGTSLATILIIAGVLILVIVGIVLIASKKSK